MSTTAERAQALAAHHATVREELLRHFTDAHFRYIHFSGSEVLYTISTGWNGWAAVIGHPDQGAYEWVIRYDAEYHDQPDAFYDHSDVGYGSPETALRDGLTAVLDA